MVRTEPRYQIELDRLAGDLDAAAAAAAAAVRRSALADGDTITEDDGPRQRRRRTFRIECTVHCLSSLSSPIVTLPARTRNISEGGLGVLIKRVVLRGAPLEIVIQPHGAAPIHFAGTVAFCRYAGRGFHEVGVRLHAYGANPVFIHDPARACQAHAWFTEACRLLTP